jgi:hypothetical protein
MLTSALITLAQNDYSPDWSRPKILTILDELQKMVFTQKATAQMRMYDSSTGLDPKLTTTSGTYEYNINTTAGFSHNAWMVSSVYSSDIDDPEEVLTIEATPSTAYAKVVFPKIVSGDYYIRCYRFPTSLTSESVQLEIPSSYHLSHIYEGLIGFMEKVKSGRSDRYEMFKLKLLPELLVHLSDNGKKRDKKTIYRPAG